MRTVSVGAARLRRWLDGFVERHGSAVVGGDAAVLTLVGADGAQAWVHVPFPPLAGPPEIAALVAHAERSRRIGVLLVRRGGYAAGIFAGTVLEASKVGSSYVQGTTKAGGWSQQRYARRRANQASAAFADAADTAVRVFGTRKLDALVLGGDKAGVQEVLADRRLSHLSDRVSGPWLAVKDPRLRVLQATPEQFLIVRIDLDP